uniref:Uncharacterized protein n=1 Tax=Solanum tuberosum TaxID=4113 RepID=M1DE79_SOLTU
MAYPFEMYNGPPSRAATTASRAARTWDRINKTDFTGIGLRYWIYLSKPGLTGIGFTENSQGFIPIP